MKKTIAQLTISLFGKSLATVDSVMEAHRSTIDNLKAVAEAHAAKANEHHEQIVALQVAKVAAEQEAARAAVVAGKLEAILS